MKGNEMKNQPNIHSIFELIFQNVSIAGPNIRGIFERLQIV